MRVAPLPETITLEGYVVVLRDSPGANALYQGLHSIVPWDQDAYERGFEDPIVFTEVGDLDLLPTLEVARQILDRYAEIHPRESLAILYARVHDVSSPSALSRRGLKFSGYDAANTGQPFYSIIWDNKWQSGSSTTRFAQFRNQAGLFDSADVAREYMDAYLSEAHSDDAAYDPGELVIWEVYLVD